jgi:hypothetical protein
MIIQHALRCVAAAALMAYLTGTPVIARTAAPRSATGYDQPPQAILDVMRAPSPPLPDVSPTHDRMLLVSWTDYPHHPAPRTEAL